MDFFDDLIEKLDDIIYEPVKVICAWTSEPLKHFEYERDQKKAQQEAILEVVKHEFEVELDIHQKEQYVQLEMDKKRWDAYIDHFVGMQEIKRNERILNAISEYRKSMIEDAKAIADSLSRMEMSLLAEAHKLVLTKTEEYIALQRKAEEQCDARLIEIGQKFADNERVRIKREDMILSQTEDIINAAKNFISELNEDIKRINRNNTIHVNKAAEAADKALERMGQKLAIASVNNYAIEVKD